MKYIVSHIDLSGNGPHNWVTVFDSYIAARRSFSGMKIRGKLLFKPQLVKKYPAESKDQIERLLKFSAHEYTFKIAEFKERNNVYTIFISK